MENIEPHTSNSTKTVVPPVS